MVIRNHLPFQPRLSEIYPFIYLAFSSIISGVNLYILYVFNSNGIISMDVQMTNEIGIFGNHGEFGCIIGSVVLAAQCVPD